MRSYANNLAPHSIRVNSVHPSGVDPHMVTCPYMTLEANPRLVAETTTPMPVHLLDTRDVSNAVLYLVSEDSRHITGTAMSVDTGRNIKD